MVLAVASCLWDAAGVCSLAAAAATTVVVRSSPRCRASVLAILLRRAVLLLPLVMCTTLHAADVLAPEVDTPLGRVRGRQLKPLGTQVNAFLGVPFAAPPTADRRFRPPERAAAWTDVHDATKLPPACVQEKDGTFGKFVGSDMWNANTRLSEDCLYLNMWVPVGGVKRAGGLPVAVWLFGGGYWYGSASLDLYNGSVLAAAGNVIVINLNYRVGPFGFLYLGTKDVPGNMGLLDQQMGLMWIKENIASFGGDPTKVGLFGESAGSASIVAHMLNPVSNQLFNNGIMESGALDNSWSMDRPAKAKRKSLELAKAVGCRNADLDALARCLRDKDAALISKHIWDVTMNALEFPLVIVSQDEHFFPIDAFEALRHGYYAKNINVMIGINHDEGNFWNIYSMPKSYPWNTSLPIMSPREFEKSIDEIYFKHHSLIVRQGAKFTYWDKDCSKAWTTPSSTTVSGHSNMVNRTHVTTRGDRMMNFYANQVNQMVGDYFFTCDSLWFGDEMNDGDYGDVYVYYFDQFSSTNPWPPWTGIMHAYEIEFVFGVPLINPNYSEGEQKLSRMMIEYWTSFMETGVPSLKTAGRQGMDDWLPYSGNDKKWFYLKANEVGRIKPKKDVECAFWRAVKDHEYKMSSASSWVVNKASIPTSQNFLTLILLLSIGGICKFIGC